MNNNEVKVWEEKIAIPAYPAGDPEKNPMFLEKRVYQGSSGVVYPHAVIEKISDEKSEKIYHAVFLENQYIKIMILPELGGRIQMAFDKIKQRHFIYYNQVIKPALVGLTGPWISGGIEFNWPQHHRPSTFEPVDFTIKENEDGSKTVWVNEVERMFRTKGMAGFTLYPDKAYIEIRGKLYNRTPFPQTFLWWANPAVKVNDHYQSVFPPDVYAVVDHGKRDVSSFPIANGVYYKVDYSPGTDISKYKNIPVPTSYMAIKSKYNFIGGYEHDTKGGLLHIADHHISPGKKQWTWGHGEFGQAWDRNLTDEDGPYIEIMTGVYTDNQPDFSWLQPYEEKSFVQYFMPYSEVGMVKNATKEAIVNIEFEKDNVSIKLYTTAEYKNIKVAIVRNDKEIFSEIISSSPANPYLKEIRLQQPFIQEEITLVITDLVTNKILVSYQKEKLNEQEIPSPAQAAKRPLEVENNEQLYLTGLHLEQYRHATYMATDYYEEALRRDPKDSRNNNAMGLWYLRRGQFAKAEPYFRKAISTLTQRNSNPYDGEVYYNLGWALKMQNMNKEAFDAFYKAVWNDAWQHAGYLNLARMAVINNNYEDAFEFVQKSLIKNYHSHTARHLKTVILRKLNRYHDAAALLEESLALDPFNFGCLFEKYLLLSLNRKQGAAEVLKHLRTISRNWVHNFIEYAFDYSHTGLYDEAKLLLSIHADEQKDVYPMVEYYLGWFAYQSGQTPAATKHFEKGASLSPDFVFPNRIEDVAVLEKAMQVNPKDAKAAYYLGNFWYDKRQYSDAIVCWERSVAINDSFATVHRNLSLAYYNKLNDPERALVFLEKAFSLDTTDARVLMELDQLYKKLNKAPKERLIFLEKHLALTESRDDLYLERITLLNQTGEFSKAKELLSAHSFHPWEGGEGKVVNQYLICHLELTKLAIEKGEYQSALELLHNAENYPSNLGEGKLPGAQENDINYLKGLAYDYLGLQELAENFYRQATNGMSEPVQAIFYNDPQPDKIFYQGLAWSKLNKKEKASSIFRGLIEFGEEHLNDHIGIDYFAVSLPDLLVFDADLDLRNKVHCLYLMALGNMGLGNGNTEKAEQWFNEVLQLDINHQGAAIHKLMMNYLLFAE
jgi:tetratricopeptide (TPR) repeat protein